MRTVIAAHELLPKGLQLEGLCIEAGKVTVLASPVGSRSCCPLCGRGSSRVHSRYFPHGLGPALARNLGRAGGPRQALVLRRGLVRAAYLLREATGGDGSRPQDLSP